MIHPLTQWRVAHNLSISDLAYKLGKPVWYVEAVERGQLLPNLTTQEAIFFHTTPQGHYEPFVKSWALYKATKENCIKEA